MNVKLNDNVVICYINTANNKELLENCRIYRDIALSQLSEEELGICQE